MTEPASRPPFSKVRVLASAFIDIAIDLVLPTVIYFLLAPTHLPAIVRLTIGGYFVAAKAGAGHLSSENANGHRESFFRVFGFGVLLAVIATAVTVGMTSRGFSDSAAIACGTLLLATVQGVKLLRGHRKLDGFGLLVLLELAATIVLTSIGKTPRFILIRPSFYTAIAGFYVLATMRAERPFMMQITKPMATEGDPVRAEAFERAGRESVAFRRAEQGMTAGLGLVLLAEAALRVVIVWSHSQSEVFAASFRSQGLSIGIFIVWFVVIKLLFVPIASREVDSFMPKARNPENQA